jgi:hypothetical protein
MKREARRAAGTPPPRGSGKCTALGPSPSSARKMLCWQCQTCHSVVFKDGSVKVTCQD